jgi:carboxylesterase type B
MPQVMDIYTPSGDTESSRPLIVYMHTGNFLPPLLNGSALGTKTDNQAVEICSRFARMGYVVASIDYRLGWNPTAATQAERTYQLINAAYRGVQDARTAVRYFRMNAAEMGNEYGVILEKVQVDMFHTLHLLFQTIMTLF